MNEKDYAELASLYASLGGTFFAVWITTVSGYLVVAYVVGSQLNRSQITVLNTIYIFGSLLAIVAFHGSFNSQAYYVLQLKIIAPDSPQIMNYYITWGVSFCAILVVLASLKFMWDIRHPKKL